MLKNRSNRTPRVRIAPSPTGNLHVGTARTALYNWLFARKYGGKFILRIEDTDQVRSKLAYEKNITDGLSWLGLDWDEGPDKGGDFGPYRQTERSIIYRKYLDKLISENKAYYCYCTQAQLEKEKSRARSESRAPVYQGHCCNLSPAEQRELKKKNPEPVVRFRVPAAEEINFEDLVRGELSFNTKDIGDFVIAKHDGSPLFLLANVIDDATMEISHVIRGEDHLPNVPKQILLARALSFSSPAFVHLSLILNPDKSKMSKRAGPTQIEEYKKMGYLPEALINYLSLLGWNPGTTQEIFTTEELVSTFTIEGINKAGAIFDLQRLNWINSKYVRSLSPTQLLKESQKFLPKAALKLSSEQVQKMLTTLQERLEYLSQIPELIKIYLEEPTDYDPRLLIWKKATGQETLNVLQKLAEFWPKLERKKTATPDEIEQILRDFVKDKGLSVGKVFWPLRVSLSGLEASPGPQEIIWVLGAKTSLKRLKKALKLVMTVI